MFRAKAESSYDKNFRAVKEWAGQMSLYGKTPTEYAFTCYAGWHFSRHSTVPQEKIFHACMARLGYKTNRKSEYLALKPYVDVDEAPGHTFEAPPDFVPVCSSSRGAASLDEEEQRLAEEERLLSADEALLHERRRALEESKGRLATARCLEKAIQIEEDKRRKEAEKPRLAVLRSFLDNFTHSGQTINQTVLFKAYESWYLVGCGKAPPGGLSQLESDMAALGHPLDGEGAFVSLELRARPIFEEVFL